MRKISLFIAMGLDGYIEYFSSAASGIFSTFQQTASALGISIIGGIFYSILEHEYFKNNYLFALSKLSYSYKPEKAALHKLD